MGTIIEIIINAVLLSSMYILAASGFALVLSIMGVLNFAHASFYMLGAYFAYQISTYMGFWVGFCWRKRLKNQDCTDGWRSRFLASPGNVPTVFLLPSC